MLVELTEFETQLRTQILKNWKNYNPKRIDLGIAREKQQYDLAGKYICVEKLSSADAAVTIILNDKDNGELDLVDGLEIETLFKKVFITNAAQADEWIDIIFGADFKYKKKIAGLKFIDRGNLLVYDFVKADFTFDDTWHELDLSSFIPKNCLCMYVHVQEVCNAAYPFTFRPKGYAGNVSVSGFVSKGGFAICDHSVFIVPNKDSVIEYKGYAAAGVFEYYFAVLSYFI